MIALLVILLLYNVIPTLTLKDNKCTEQNIHKSVQIYCPSVPNKNQWKKINNATTHVFMTCAIINNGINITLDNNQLENMKKISFFYIKNCQLNNFPNEYFKNLINLENVVLDNIPIQYLQSNVFKNSSNLSQLTFLRLYKLWKISPRFMATQNKFSKFYVIESNITADQMKPILISVYITLTDLYWRKNKQKLIFHKFYFQNFMFDNLLLENNEIDNTNFLHYVHTKSLSLKYNPISLFKKFAFPFIEGLQSLNLAFTGLSGTFPEEKLTQTLNTLKELIISDNRIEGLPKNIDILFPGLKVLDVRNNRLTTLQSTLHLMLTKNLGKILNSGNMFHCNCQMQWLTLKNIKLSKQIKCRTIATSNGTIFSNKTLNEMSSKLLCTEPKLNLELYEQFKDRKYSVIIEDNNVKTYRIVLENQTAINWKCEGRGDPAPNLKWISEGQTLKITKPPLRKYETLTVMNNLVVEAMQDSMTFICKGTNIIGNNIVKLTVLREDKSAMQSALESAKIVSRRKNMGYCSNLSKSLILSLFCFTTFINFNVLA